MNHRELSMKIFEILLEIVIFFKIVKNSKIFYFQLKKQLKLWNIEVQP
jgi:hypothetical protein